MIFLRFRNCDCGFSLAVEKLTISDSTVVVSLIRLIDGREQPSLLGSRQPPKEVYTKTEFIEVAPHFDGFTLCLGIKPTFWSLKVARAISSASPLQPRLSANSVVTVIKTGFPPLRFCGIATYKRTAPQKSLWVPALNYMVIGLLDRVHEHDYILFWYTI